MNIAIFCESYLPQANGTETHVSTLAKGLRALGHHALVVSSDLEAEDAYEQEDAVFCPARPSGSSYGQSARRKGFSFLKKKLLAFQPDVVHLASLGTMGSFGLSYALQMDLPLAVTVLDLRNALSGFSGSAPYRRLTRDYCRNLLKKAVSFADAAAAVSPGAGKALESLGAACQLTPVPLCVDLSLFRVGAADGAQTEAMRKRLGLNGRTGVLAVGNLDHFEEFSLLLEHWAAAVPGENSLHLAVAGNGSALPALREKAASLGISRRVTFAGQIPHEEMPACYAACAAYVSATQSEWVKASVYEATACGLPAILYQGSASCSLISNGVNGFLYRSPQELAPLLEKLTGLDEKTQAKLRSLVERTALPFGPEALGKAMLECYQAATEEHRRKSKEKE